MKLKQFNNCNKIYASGDEVDVLMGDDFSNIRSIVMTASVNNCQVAEHQLSFTDTEVTLPNGVSTLTECEDLGACATTLIYSNVYADLFEEINTNVMLLSTIQSTSSTLPFCGLVVDTGYGNNILGININTGSIILQTTGIHNSDNVNRSLAIKNEIVALLTSNSITYNSVTVTHQINTNRPVQSKYNININSTVPMTGSVVTSNGNLLFAPNVNCTNDVYGFNHKRSTFNVSNYNADNTSIVKWYTNKSWDYNTATGVYIESYNNNTFNITYNVFGEFIIYMEIVTDDPVQQNVIYNWTVNGTSQQILNPVASKSAPHYTITPNGDTNVISGSVLTGATANNTSGDNCTNYLILTPSFFAVTNAASINNTVFPDGIYSLNITIIYKDGTSIQCNDGLFMNCVLKCAVADCVYSTKSYELMTLYNSLVALDDCDSYYVSEMSELFHLILSSLCYPIGTLTNTLNQDCGCT